MLSHWSNLKSAEAVDISEAFSGSVVVSLRCFSLTILFRKHPLISSIAVLPHGGNFPNFCPLELEDSFPTVSCKYGGFRMVAELILIAVVAFIYRYLGLQPNLAFNALHVGLVTIAVVWF